MKAFSLDRLELDVKREIESICAGIRQVISKTLKRRGAVVGLSGGIDSSVTLGLCVKALGPERVLSILMPETGVDPESQILGEAVARHFGAAYAVENVTPTLNALGYYERYNNAVRKLIPEYNTEWTSKIVATDVLASKGFTFFSLVARDPGGNIHRMRLPLKAYLEIVAATNFKQRTRKMIEYYHADRLHYAVAGTPNRLEYELGFFVKQGDGAADLKPIAHLYKTQVYQIASFLGIPHEVLNRPPTTGTYSLNQGQDEFFFSLPHDKMDLCLFAFNNAVPAAEAASAAGLTIDQVERVFADIRTKRATTRYLHLPPVLMSDALNQNCA